MAQVVPTASPSSLLLTPDAPYSVYLRALKHEGWDDYDLESWLKVARDNLDDVRGGLSTHWPPLTIDSKSKFAAIVDIRSERGVDDAVVVAQLERAQIQGERVGTINSGVADDFLDSLRTCAANVHMRIIILQDTCIPVLEPMSKDNRGIQRLFNSHLLGIELNLSPAFVCHLLQGPYHHRSHMRMRGYPNVAFVDGRVALYLGQRKFGDGHPYTGECT
jgi:prepilin-type processing-associated H-X9-DG protein